MSSPTARALAADFRSQRGGWSLYGLRFERSEEDESTHRFGTWVTIAGGTVSAEMEVTERSYAQAQRTAAALRIAGYTVGRILKNNWLFARRPLRGQRELVAETRRLEMIALDRDAIGSLPHRMARPLGQARRPLPQSAFDYLRFRKGWIWTWAAAERRGHAVPLPDTRHWRVLAYCSVLEDRDEEVHLDVGMQISCPSRGDRIEPRELGRIKKVVMDAMRPAGYRALKFTSKSPSPSMVMVDKKVRTLAEARTECARLDRLLFDGRSKSMFFRA